MNLFNTIIGNVYYDSILSDPRLIDHRIYDEDIDTIMLWQDIGKEYGICDDQNFFVYAMKQYIKGYNRYYGITFLYAESSALRNNKILNDYLTSLVSLPVNNYTEDRSLTYEEKVMEYNDLDLCPFVDEPSKAQELCKKHFNCCEVCRKCELKKDSMYLPFVKQMKLKQNNKNE